MTERVDLFFHTLSFTPVWAVVDALLIVHFFWSWARSVKREGWKIDFWYLTLLMGVFQSLCVLYPFNGSIYNAPCLMGNYHRVLPFIDQAFFISVLGYLFIWIGRYAFDWTRGQFPLILCVQFCEPLCRLVENNMKSRKAHVCLAFIALFLGLCIVAIQFKEGCFFNARGWFLKEPFLRPVFNLTISIFSIAFSFLSLRYLQFKEKMSLAFFGILIVISLFFGIRSLVLGALLALFTQKIFYNRGKINLLKLFSLCSLLFFCAVTLGNLREGNYDFLNAFVTVFVKYFYGNNLSDTRDFAWVLAFWDGDYLYGKTYVAALLSFIPRAFSSIRAEWGISMVTNEFTGFDSEIMPGLRPGLFGEAFLNFSYPGVILFGLLFGFVLRYTDVKIKEYVNHSLDIIKGYSKMIAHIFLSCISVSAGMWFFYVYIFLNLALFCVRGENRASIRDAL